jgi:hypothetical protein
MNIKPSSFDGDVDYVVGKRRSAPMPLSQRAAFALLILMLLLCIVAIVELQGKVTNLERTSKDQANQLIRLERDCGATKRSSQ